MNYCLNCEVEMEQDQDLCAECAAQLVGSTGERDDDRVEESAAASESTAYLQIDNGDRYDIDKSEVVLGRIDPVEDIHPDVDLGIHKGFDLGVSRRHALILRDEDQYSVEDLGSTNGTIVNREKIQPGDRTSLREGDIIFLGRLKAVFHSTETSGGV